jgi:hypothetical protein
VIQTWSSTEITCRTEAFVTYSSRRRLEREGRILEEEDRDIDIVIPIIPDGGDESVIITDGSIDEIDGADDGSA